MTWAFHCLQVITPYQACQNSIIIIVGKTHTHTHTFENNSKIEKCGDAEQAEHCPERSSGPGPLHLDPNGVFQAFWLVGSSARTRLGPPVVLLYQIFFGGGFPCKNILQKKGALILASPLEDLVGIWLSHFLSWSSWTCFWGVWTVSLRVFRSDLCLKCFRAISRRPWDELQGLGEKM